MYYSWYLLCWFFFLYSFVGWICEVSLAAFRRHTFVNRGFVSSPLCPIYGISAVAFALFLPELANNIPFLFLGGFLIAGFVEYTAGHLLELVFHRKWWDYSHKSCNVGGYICLQYSTLWGLLSILVIRILNPSLAKMLSYLPALPGKIILIALSLLLFADAVGSFLTLKNLRHKAGRFDDISDELRKTSYYLENSLTHAIERRMTKAYPAIHPDTLTAEELTPAKSDVFAEGLCFSKLFLLFVIGAFLGDLVETLFCRVRAGIWMSRSSLVWGPFSIVWGLGCAGLTALLYRYRNAGDSILFLMGTVLGGAYEYICSVFTELVFGTVFWDYSHMPFNLGGRINLLYCFFWGIAAVVWFKWIYPYLSRAIEHIPLRYGKYITRFLVAFMTLNMAVSALALGRYTDRQYDRQPPTAADQWLDEHFPDERIERIYPNLILR